MLDHDHILRQATLRYSPDTRTGVTENGRRIVKQVRARRYLGLSKDQHNILKRFKEPAKVSDVLADLIRDRACPSLKTFYELILKAVDARLLLPEGTDDVREVKALSWPLKIGPRWSRLITGSAILAALILPLFFGLSVPDYAWEMAVAIFLTMICASLGHVLAASHLRWAHGEVYHPHVVWFSFIPRIVLDLSDSGLLEKSVRQQIALLKITPQLIFLALAAWLYPPVSYIAFTGVVLLTIPVAGTPLIDYLRARFDSHALSTDREFLFNPNRVFWNIFRLSKRPGRARFMIVNAIATAIWLATVYFVNLRVFNFNGDVLIQRAYEDYFGVAVLVLVTLFASMFLSGFSGISLLLRNLRSLSNRPQKRHKRVRLKEDSSCTGDGGEALAMYLKKCYIIEQIGLDDEALRKLVQITDIVDYAAGTAIVEEGQAGNHFYIILKGETEVIRTDVSGRESISARLGSGEAFGEIALLENTQRTRTVRALTRTRLLQIERSAFFEFLVAQVGTQSFEDLLQKQAFLRRLPFTEDWHPRAIQEFAENLNLVEYPRNTLMLRRGHDNRFFFIVYEGLFDIRIGKKRIGKVGPGEFLGEISLLQSSSATADVVAIDDCRCYAMDRKKFIKFISEDFIVSMYFEKVSSQRLKRRIFPLNGVSLEAYRT